MTRCENGGANCGARYVARKFALAVLGLFVMTLVSSAQDFRGSLVGTVTDTSGARVPSAAVVLHSDASSLDRQTTTDSRGQFRFADLLPGAYRMTVRAAGFSDAD